MHLVNSAEVTSPQSNPCPLSSREILPAGAIIQPMLRSLLLFHKSYDVAVPIGATIPPPVTLTLVQYALAYIVCMLKSQQYASILFQLMQHRECGAR